VSQTKPERKPTNPNIKLTPDAEKLKAFVAKMKANNDRFEASLAERHARWDVTGIGQPLPPKRGTMGR
jgi:hypothetical protein